MISNIFSFIGGFFAGSIFGTLVINFIMKWLIARGGI